MNRKLRKSLALALALLLLASLLPAFTLAQAMSTLDPAVSDGEPEENEGLEENVEEVTLDESDFRMSSNNLVYVPGQPVEYTITETLPSNIGERTSITIIDEYDLGRMTYDPAGTELRIGDTLLTPITHYNLQFSNTTGILTVTILDAAYSFDNLGGASLVLRLTFNTGSGIHSAITNKASIAYDGKRVYEDEVILDESDFRKEAFVNFYEPGSYLEYTLSATLPDNLYEAGIRKITVNDEYNPNLMSIVPGDSTVVLTIGGVRLNYGTHYSITHNRVLGILTVTILDVVWPFATQGGKWLSLKLTFQIAGNAEGPIMNGGDIYYNDIKGGEDEEEVSRSEFSKSSDNLVYIPGQPVKYTITETLPSNIGERFEIKIYDEYEQDKMDYDPAKTELWIGGTLLTQNAHYSVQNDATNGILTFTILYQAFPSYFYNLGGASVVLKLSFNTDPGIHSAITNKASIAYDGKKVHEDEVILEIAYKPGDVNGDGLINMQDVLLIYQHVRGRVLLTGPGLAAADVNGKDSVTMQDVLLVYHFFRGIIHSFN